MRSLFLVLLMTLATHGCSTSDPRPAIDNAVLLREAIDQYNADNVRYPASLQELVDEGYLREIPPDSSTGRPDTWVLIWEPHGAGIFDVRPRGEP